MEKLYVIPDQSACREFNSTEAALSGIECSFGLSSAFETSFHELLIRRDLIYTNVKDMALNSLKAI